MDNDDHATAPFPGRPIGADVDGDTLTIYFTATDDRGRHIEQRITSTTTWTLDAITAELAAYGLTPRDARLRTRGIDALGVAVAGTFAIGERVAAAAQHVARGLAAALTARPAAGRHA